MDKAAQIIAFKRKMICKLTNDKDVVKIPLVILDDLKTLDIDEGFITCLKNLITYAPQKDNGLFKEESKKMHMFVKDLSYDTLLNLHTALLK